MPPRGCGLGLISYRLLRKVCSLALAVRIGAMCSVTFYSPTQSIFRLRFLYSFRHARQDGVTKERYAVFWKQYRTVRHRLSWYGLERKDITIVELTSKRIKLQQITHRLSVQNNFVNRTIAHSSARVSNRYFRNSDAPAIAIG